MLSLLKYLKPYVKTIAFAGFLTLVQLGGELMLPRLMSLILNEGVEKGDIAAVWQYGSFMLIIAVMSVFIAIILRRLINKVSVSYAFDVRHRVFSKTASLSSEDFNAIGNASLQTRSTNDVQWMTEMINWLFRILTLPLLFVGGIIFALQESVTLSAISLVAVPAILLVIVVIGRLVRPLMKIANYHGDKSLLIMRERLTGIRVIRAFGKEEYEDNRFKKQVKIMSSNFIRNNSMHGSLMPLLTFINNVVILLLLWFGSKLVLDSAGLLSSGSIIAVVQYVNMIISAIVGMSFILIMMPTLSTSAKRINEVLDKTAEDLDGVRMAEKLSGNIEIKDMTFSYGKTAAAAALSNINMTFDRTKTTAIVGGTGSGKSTLAKLLVKFYTPTEGSISFDGVDTNDLSAEYLRDCVAYITQIPVIFKGTVKSNVLLGNLAASDEAVLKALDTAQMGSFVAGKADGLDYELSEGGKNLSGGQRQRLSIARGLVRDCNIIIFDDSFSALDYATDLKLRTALNENYQHSTKIIITQRVATALNADRIYVLEKGEITAFGTHDELLATSPTYQKLAKLQMNIEGVVE